MARIATDQSTVLQRVVARLIDQIDALNTSNCYASAEPDPTVEKSHHLFVQVSVGDGQYNGVGGGGINQVFEESSVWVTVFSRIKLDQVHQSKQALYDASRGLLTLKKSILQALAGHDLQDDSGDEILISYMAPRVAARPVKEAWDGFSVISIQVSTDFEWDLT